MTAIKQVRKAVIPAAGLGTRFLPATKATPKEMLPIVDKPTIQYIIEEALASGIEDILIITGRSKRAIEDHFDRSIELELNLAAGGKAQELEMVKKISDIRIHYIRQKEPRGLGHAILCAKQFIGDEPFAVLLGDDVVDGMGNLMASIADFIPQMQEWIRKFSNDNQEIMSLVNQVQFDSDKAIKWGISVLGNGAGNMMNTTMSAVGSLVSGFATFFIAFSYLYM